MKEYAEGWVVWEWWSSNHILKDIQKHLKWTYIGDEDGIWSHLFSSLISSKRIPSLWTPYLCMNDDTLIILPSVRLLLAVFFIVSIKRFVKRNWPEENIYAMGDINWGRQIRTSWHYIPIYEMITSIYIPKWLTANVCSMLSLESVNLKGAKIPALLLSKSKEQQIY